MSVLQLKNSLFNFLKFIGLLVKLVVGLVLMESVSRGFGLDVFKLVSYPVKQVLKTGVDIGSV